MHFKKDHPAVHTWASKSYPEVNCKFQILIIDWEQIIQDECLPRRFRIGSEIWG